MKKVVIYYFIILFCGLGADLSAVYPQSDTINKIIVKGNAKVESDAIIALLKSQKGDVVDPQKIAQDVRTLFDLGYFSDIKFFKEPDIGGINLIIEVKEKPSIVSIQYRGMHEFSEDDFKDDLQTKLYTIVNEGTITSDMHLIEKKYMEKGYYLAHVSYVLEKKGANEADLIFVVDEGGLVKVGNIEILGNKYFSDGEILNNLLSKPITRLSSFSSTGSMFQDAFLERDLEYIAFLYRDQGFAEVKIAKPIKIIDKDKKFVRITIQIEEGVQYKIGKITISGDVLFDKAKLFELMKLKSGKLFRYSQFQHDVVSLIDKYGDIGYAFVDVNPQHVFHKGKNPTVDLNYNITKGEKVFFGKIIISGNSKTRDNVIRRELEIADSNLYSGTRLSQSKKNLERLGFFKEVKAIRKRDPEDKKLLNYNIKIEEKPTGQLQAAIAYQPGQSRAENSIMGQGSYKEANQSGRGWAVDLSGKWNGKNTYSLGIGFTDPRVNDTFWSFGAYGSVNNIVKDLTEDISVQEKSSSASITIGRKIIELIKGYITYKIEKTETTSDSFVIQAFKKDGIGSSLIFRLSRNATNNYLDPSEGSKVSLSQSFTGGPILMGDFDYNETLFDGSYYQPLNITEKLKSYFHFHLQFGYIYPMGSNPVPLSERYRLGGFNDLRGYNFNEVSPHFNILQDPTGTKSRYPKGGDKKLYFQGEYLIPIISEAGIKGVLFYDIGRVFDDNENISLSGFKKDVGFGFRWITPIAPFRFEWAYPIENGKLGERHFIFYLGF